MDEIERQSIRLARQKFSQLTEACVALFDTQEEEELFKTIVEVLKIFNYEATISSPKLRVAEFRGKEIVTTIFETLSTNGKGIQLMPYDFQELYNSVRNDNKQRVICDYIAGMTDRYCIEFYGRLKSMSPETIFKPF